MLFAWANYILEQPTTHLSKHYDGIRVSLDRCNAEEPISLPGPVDGKLTGVDALCMHSTQFIKDQTGFEMRIRHKVHKTCFDLISAYAEKKSLRVYKICGMAISPRTAKSCFCLFHDCIVVLVTICVFMYMSWYILYSNICESR